MMLEVPSIERKNTIIKGFLDDQRSYTNINPLTDAIESVVCSVCDGIPKTPQWASWICIDDFVDLCNGNNLHKDRIKDFYPEPLLNSYTAPHPRLTRFVLSPLTRINQAEGEVLVCNDCRLTMEASVAKKVKRIDVKPPKQAIANGYLIGDPPPELACLNQVELALISRVRIYCQSWVFFGGCHQQIKGWHTFFKNRSSSNIANIEQLQLCGLKGILLVVLCGPFTSTQKALTLKQVKVNPERVITAYKWLKANNYHYKDEPIPTIEEIPIPHLVIENE